ncbi:MAG: peptidyl-prolyl cis-trans isomerase [Bdellovibrionaceae bacterium]|nr:peptidyl-prolyl cis-trans isomerase [Pseudobdellovibrionaceae bacterium]
MKVNQTEISAQEFSDRLAKRLRGFDALHAKDDGNLKRAKEQTIEAFVLEVVVRDFAAANALQITDLELEAEITAIRSKYPDDHAFRRALADEGLAFDLWKRDLAFTLMQKRVLAHVMKDVRGPTEAEMKVFYDENRKLFDRPARIQLRQIVLETEDNAKRILDELNAGKNFGELAKKFSVAPEGENGGVTSWIEKGTLEVFDNAFKLQVGARSKIVKSPYGWHIFEVIKKEPEARLNFEQAKDRIRALVMERKEQSAFSDWLGQQMKKSAVLRNDALIKAIQVTTRGT